MEPPVIDGRLCSMADWHANGIMYYHGTEQYLQLWNAWVVLIIFIRLLENAEVASPVQKQYGSAASSQWAEVASPVSSDNITTVASAFKLIYRDTECPNVSFVAAWNLIEMLW